MNCNGDYVLSVHLLRASRLSRGFLFVVVVVSVVVCM